MTPSIKVMCAAAILATASVTLVDSASAMPLGSGMRPVDHALVQVGWRCGPGRHMTRFGCIPNRRWRRY
jgi:hypothetical protein